MNDLATAALACVRAGYDDMTIRQIAILGVICDEEQPHSTGSIARRLKVDKPVISRFLRRFEERGMIEQATCSKDRRRNLVKLTPLGVMIRENMRFKAKGRP